MRVYMNRMPLSAAWGGGNNFFNAIASELPKLGHQYIPANDGNTAPDVILLVATENDGTGISADQAIMYKMMMEAQGRSPKIVLRVNENDARKGTRGVDKRLLEISKHVDGTIFVSRWLQEYFQKLGWGSNPSIVAINGVDKSIYKPNPNKLNNGKINLVTHHWSDNEKKGFDVYNLLDEWVGTPEGSKFTFNYIGRSRGKFKNTNVVKPLWGAELGEELGKYDVYISASRFDPGPNHIVESIACGLPTYVHVEGGGCVEFAGADHSFKDWDELKALLLSGKFTLNSTSFTDWNACIKQCADFMEKLCKLGSMHYCKRKF